MKSVIVLSLVLIAAVLVYVSARRQGEPIPYEPFSDVSGSEVPAPSAPSAPANAAAPKPVTAADLEKFRKSLKEELLNSLKFDTAVKSPECVATTTPATEQGVEYIRKDSIPCWGCKL
jgi:hypothetical protein